MSIESRLLRGDNPDDVAKLFGRSPEDMAKLQKALKPRVVKKKGKSNAL